MTLQHFLARLTWISIAPVVLAAVLLAGADLLGHHRDDTRAAEGRATGLAATLDAELRARIQGLSLLAQSAALDNPIDTAAFLEQLRDWRELHGSHAMLADASGAVLAHTAQTPSERAAGTPAPALPEVIDEPFRRAALASGAVALSGVYRGRVTHEDKVAVLVPVLRPGRASLIVLAELETRPLGAALPASSLPPGWSAEVRDREGRTVDTLGTPADSKTSTPRASVTLATAPWRLELRANEGLASPELVREAVIFATGLAIALLAAWWAARRASRRLSRHLAELLETPADTTTSETRIDEIAALRAQLDAAAQAHENAERSRRAAEQNYRESLEAANRALRLSEGRLKAIVESAGDAILILDATGTIVMANPAAARLHGCEPERLLGSPMTKWIPQRLQSSFRTALASLGGQAFDYRRSRPGDDLAVLQAGGGEVQVAATLSVVMVDGEPLHSLALHDIREQRRALRSLDQSLARLEAVVAGLDEAVRIIDAAGQLVVVNEAYARLHRFASPQACRDALAEHPDILALADGEGRRLPDQEAPLMRARQTGEIATADLAVTRRDTGERWTVRYRAFPLRGRDGAPLGAVETGRELTRA